MNANEMCETFLKGGIGYIMSIYGDMGALTDALRTFKADKMPIRGLVKLNLSNCKGTNIRKVNLTDASAVFKVFDTFTTEAIEKCRRPIFDFEHDGLVASDGWKMLASRIPPRFPIADAVPSGFTNEIAFRWREIAEELEASDYNLSAYRRMATVQKGSALHGFLQAVRAAVSAYAFEDDEGFYHTFYLKVGKKFYDATGVANLVDALYKLGCTSVALCEKTAWSGSHMMQYTPLHIYGMGGEVDAKGVVMLMKYADDSMGAFVMPTGKATERKKVA